MATAVVHTLKPSGQGGDYSLMSTWESTEQRDLVSLDQTETLECYAGDYGGLAGSLNETVQINTWTVSATNNITITAPAGGGHLGVPGDGFKMYALGTQVLWPAVRYMVISDITIIGNASGDNPVIYLSSNGADTTVKNCIVSQCASAGQTVKHKGSAGNNNSLINLLLCDVPGFPPFIGNGPNLAGSNNVVDNCTGITGSGANTGCTGSPNVTNSVFCGFATDINTTGTKITSASSDGTGNITGVVLTDGVDFVEPSTGDYRATSTGKLGNTATDLSTIFLDDITGELR